MTNDHQEKLNNITNRIVVQKRKLRDLGYKLTEAVYLKDKITAEIDEAQSVEQSLFVEFHTLTVQLSHEPI